MKLDISKQTPGADAITQEATCVNLYTMSGGFVACLPMIGFVKAPEILTWGSRSFVATQIVCSKEEAEFFHYRGDPATPLTTRIQYREALNYVIPVFYDEQKREWTSPFTNITSSGGVPKQVEINPCIEVTAPPQGSVFKRGETCPECHTENGLHRRTCFIYQKNLEELTRRCVSCHAYLNNNPICHVCGRNNNP